MKRYKVLLVALMAVISMAALGKGDEFKLNPEKRVLNVSILEAVKIPGLTAEMYKQLTPAFLSNNQLVYTKYVVLKNTCYRINGTWEQWDLFFRHRIDVEQAKIKPGSGIL